MESISACSASQNIQESSPKKSSAIFRWLGKIQKIVKKFLPSNHQARQSNSGQSPVSKNHYTNVSGTKTPLYIIAGSGTMGMSFLYIRHPNYK